MEQQQSIDRHNSGSLKWDLAGKDELPLWVADMDFSSPRVVLDALHQRLEHPVLGYTRVNGQSLENFSAWCERHQGWKPEIQDLVLTGGMLNALGMALQFFTQPGDGVVIQTPVYHPFGSIPAQMGRRLIHNPLVSSSGSVGNPFRMDLAGLAELFVAEKPRVLVLCSPHNPVGRVWTETELAALIEICLQHQVLLISDEIHADIILPGFNFVSLGALCGPGKRFPGSAAIVLQSPSKTFNIPGLPTCLAYVPDAGLRQKMRDGIGALGMSTINVLSQVACSAAYGGADEWMTEILGLLDTNYRILDLQVLSWRDRWPRWAENGLGLHLTVPEGTYLAWVGVRPLLDALELNNSGFQQWLRKNAGVFVSAGSQFGVEGEDFIRINIATHESVLTEALDRMQQAFDRLY